MNTLETVYTEFVEGNLDKKYPLADSSDLNIPDSFLADIKIMIGAMDNAGDLSYRYTTYVSEIHVYVDYIYVYISVDNIGQIAVSDPIATNLNLSDPIENRTIRIRPTSDIAVNGTIIVGTCEHISDVQGVTSGTGYLFPANVFVCPEQIGGIRVGDTVLTGDINIEASGDLEVSVDPSTNTIQIGVISTDSNLIGPEKALLDALSEKYGKPICSINGLPPDEKGNFNILPTDCLMVEKDAEHNALSFYNPCGSTCASEDFMEDAYTRIADLNRNYALLIDLYKSVSGVLAQMGARVSSVLEQRRDSITSNTSE